VSTSRLRARLDRLERSGSTAVADPFGFNIDPTLAKSLRDDCDRLYWLLRDNEPKKPRSADVTEETERLRAIISERARTITCPVGYGPVQAREDSRRADRLWSKRTWGIGLTDAEDAEEAQLKARVCAYRESPEGRARAQIFNLTIGSWLPRGCSPAQREELDRLQAIYPGPIVEI
jgi:hypothetical protein